MGIVVFNNFGSMVWNVGAGLIPARKSHRPGGGKPRPYSCNIIVSGDSRIPKIQLKCNSYWIDWHTVVLHPRNSRIFGVRILQMLEMSDYFFMVVVFCLTVDSISI